MTIYNHEHYKDPTAAVAVHRMSRPTVKRVVTTPFPKVYICSPYRDNPKVNVMRARHFCRFAVAQKYLPVAPHLYFPQFMSDETQRSIAMQMNFMLLKGCRELWVFGDDITEGMQQEIDKAQQWCLTIRYFNNKCEEVIYG